ncbi:unnamed protein product [Peniophora sp. CBMAI 1063]|nr:unnamed protein product [Peniophora sp. CBMAI 1063]
MTSPAGSEDALVNEGWRRVTDGPYYAAWRQFWGKDLDFDVLQPWKAWTDALKQYDAHSLEDSVSALARSVLGGETDVHLPSCTFLESPWVDELSETKGRIMFLDDHERIYGRVRDMHAKASHRLEGVIIGGQGGVGKTYLSLYLLARRLAEKKLVFYSPNKSQFFFFDTGGVLERDGFTYSCVFSNPDLRLAVPEDTWIITDTSPVEGEPASGATMGYLFLIQLCRPEDRYFSDWARRNRTESLTLDSWSPSVVLSGYSTRPMQYQAQQRSALALAVYCTRLWNLQPLLLPGSNTASRSLRVSSDVHRRPFPGQSRRNYQVGWEGYHIPSLLAFDGPDLFSLRRDYQRTGKKEKEVMTPVIASRLVMNELRQHLGFKSLYKFREIGAIREPPDIMDNTRLWLFEQLSHALFSERTRSEVAARMDLSPCFPDGAKRGLLLEHVFQARSVQMLDDADPPAEPEPGSYFVVRNLQDSTFHSLLYITPPVEKQDSLARPDSSRVITRARARELALKDRLSEPASRDTRSSKRRRGSASLAPGPAQPPAKRPRSKADRRFVVVFQMLSDDMPMFSEYSLEKLERVRKANPSARFFFVFVTPIGQCIDVDSIPKDIVGRFGWYHLQMDFDLNPEVERRWFDDPLSPGHPALVMYE